MYFERPDAPVTVWEELPHADPVAEEPAAAGLRITELVAANTIGFAVDGVRYDWFELYNPEDRAVLLSDYCVSDDADAPMKVVLPDVILEPGQYLMLYASGLEQEGHVPFKLSKNGGTLTVTRRDGIAVEQVVYPVLKNDQAYTLKQGVYVLTYGQSPAMANRDVNEYEYLQLLDRSRTAPVLISEVMTSNSTVLKQSGAYYDWIELVNRSDTPVNLAGWTLCDKESKRDALVLPEVILGAGETFAVFASGNSELTKKQDIHSDFALSKDGEHIYLYDPDGNLADGVYAADIPAECSYGRMDGMAGFVYFDRPTPRTANGTDGVRFVAKEPTTAVAPGIYETTELFVPIQGEGRIYYTLDGSEPTADSIPYTAPICIRKTSVIRAVAYTDDGLPSQSVTFGYTLNEGHSLPVVMVACSDEDLFAPEGGIYAFGADSETEFPYNGANFYSEREVRASFTYMENGRETVSGNCGLKLFGQSSRGYEKKSFTVKFRGKYGESSLDAPFFGETEAFRTVVLRSGSQDSRRAMIRDEFFTSLAGRTGHLPVQRHRACVLYLNDEYWGVYYIRDKINEDFCADYLGVDPESVDLLQWNSTVLAGSNRDYKALIDYVTSHDLTVEKHYRYVEERVDLDNFIDYHIAQSYAGNKDNGNLKFFRSTAGDGKWRWIYFDLDFGFREEIAPLGHQINPLGTGYMNKFNNILIRKLLENPEFLTRYRDRAEELMTTVYSTEAVTSHLDAMIAEIEPEMTRDRDRWNMRMSSWRWELTVMRDFIRKNGAERLARTDYILAELDSLFGTEIQ